MLEVAPSMPLNNKLSSDLGHRYASFDRYEIRGKNPLFAMMDATQMGYADATFDLICCSHVLEHIEEDRSAIRELWRVCKPDGQASILVPLRTLSGGGEDEDPSVTAPEARRARFGEALHVRWYGVDLLSGRLEEAGFSVSVRRPESLLDPAEIAAIRPDRFDVLFVCRKQSASV